MNRLTILTFIAFTLLLSASAAYFTHEITLAGVEAKMRSDNEKLQQCNQIIAGSR